MTTEEALKKLMPQNSKHREEKIELTPTQKEQVEKLLQSRVRENTYTFWIAEQEKEPMGYAVILNVIGKEQPITFMIAVSPEGKVLGVEILAYRESQGSDVRSKRFMQQFIGKTLAEPLKLGRDVDSISGATLSSRSTVYAVKKALALVEVIYRNGKRVSP
jgi:Na+-translocating ferredoxin:NAD+ oxidoreductase RnfG subunit